MWNHTHYQNLFIESRDIEGGYLAALGLTDAQVQKELQLTVSHYFLIIFHCLFSCAV